MRPAKEELNKKIWYRLFKVAGILVLVGAFVAPWIVHKPNPFLLLDGAVNVLIWTALFFVVREVILYVLYGKREITQEKRKRMWEWAIWGTASVILVVLFLAAIYSLLQLKFR